MGRVISNRVGCTALAVVVGLHALAFMLLLRPEPVRKALTDAAPIMVRLVTPEAKRAVEPQEPPKPVPVRRHVQHATPVAPPPIIAAPVEAPSPAIAPPPEAVPLPAVEKAPAFAAALPDAAPAAPAAAPAPPVEAVVPPSFNAAYLNNPPPTYPGASRRTGEQGRVVLRVFVSEEGLPSEVQVRTSSGFSRLDEAASQTVKQWRFVPARRGKTPIGAWVLVPISFSLRT